MPEFKKLEDLIDSLKQYLMLNIEILKLEAINHVSRIGSSLVGLLVVGIFAFLFVFILSLGVGFYLSALLGDTYIGFVIVAGFYLILTIILFAGRKKIIEKPLRDKIIKKIFEEKEL